MYVVYFDVQFKCINNIKNRRLVKSEEFNDER
jgi:hypothetical protein